MRRPLAVPAISPRALPALALAAFAACSSSERPRDTARASESAAAAPATPASSLAAPAAPLPGQLTKPIDQYTGEEFFAFVRGLQFGGGAERERRCKGDPRCDDSTSTRRTRVRVDAVNGQDSIVVTGVPANGVVAVRAVNRGTLDEARYGFRADRRFEYYLIVLPGAGPNASWRFEQLDTTAGARQHTQLATGTFRPCNHPFRRGRPIRASFFTCESSPASSDSVQRSNLMLYAFPTDRDPVWSDCAAGCCIAD